MRPKGEKVKTRLGHLSNLCPQNECFWYCRETVTMETDCSGYTWFTQSKQQLWGCQFSTSSFRLRPRRSLLDADQWLKAWVLHFKLPPTGLRHFRLCSICFQANSLITLEMQHILQYSGEAIKGTEAWNWADVKDGSHFFPSFPDNFKWGGDCDLFRMWNQLHPFNHSWYEHKTFLNKLSWDWSQPMIFGLPRM